MQPQDWKATQAARQCVAEALRAANPHLIPGNDCVIAAKNIRIELKRAFPAIKFSVKTRKFSDGDAIDVSWTDGPTVAMVSPIIGRYEAGSFDGMTDCYTYERSAWTDAFGDSKYIHAYRHYSDAFIASAIAYLQARYPGNNIVATVEEYRSGATWSRDVGFGENLQQLIGQALAKRVSASCIPA